MQTKSQRQVYGETLVELGNNDQRIVVLDADLCKSTMGCLFEEAFPDRHFEMGIAEQNMASFAAGLSLTGKIPFINSFAVFVTGRAYDQIRQSICTAGLNVKIVGSSAGFSDFGDGATHQSVEDIALMRAIPGMTVIVPSDAYETKLMTEFAVNHKGPVYLRLTRNPVPDIYDEAYVFSYGKPSVIIEGTEYVIFACGALTGMAIAVAKRLKNEGYDIGVINMSTLKPVDDDHILKLTKNTKGIVTVEEHSVIGGLADVISASLRKRPIPHKTIGINDRFGQSAESWEELLEEYGLTEKAIMQAVRDLSKEN